jgi:hypothetical protein
MVGRTRRQNSLQVFGMAAAICLLLATQAVDFYHDTFVNHQVCAEHNEVLDNIAADARSAILHAPPDTAFRLDSGHSREGHSHCLFHGTAGGTRSPLREDPCTLLQRNGCGLVLSSAAGCTGAAQIAVLLQAPKNSPPA